MKRIIVLDQFNGPSPYQLQKAPYPWAEFLEDIAKGMWAAPWPHRVRPTVQEVADDWKPDWAMTAYIEDENGNVAVWRAKWDTSG